VSALLETLATELERPRELSPRVLNYIQGTYDVDNNAVGAFLVNELARLEDDAIDLILSPVFTPRLADQAVFAQLLGRDSIPREQWAALIAGLAARPTRARLVTPDDVPHVVPLREVTLERFVHRLRLEATIPDALYHRIEETPPDDRPTLKAIARNAVWDAEDRRQILTRFLDRGMYSLPDTLELLNVVEARKPSGIADLLRKIPQWRDGLRHQIDVASRSRPFFIDRVEEMHGGDRDHRSQDNVRIAAREREFAFLGRLQQALKEDQHE
jgi:hypothetical protein